MVWLIKRPLKISYFTKLTLSFFLLTTLVVLGIAFVSYFQSKPLHHNHFREILMGIVKTTASHLNGDEINQLQGKEAEGFPLYQKIEKDLEAVRKNNPDIRHLHLFRKTKDPNSLQFILDVHDKPKTKRHFGEDYDVSKVPSIKKAFKKPLAEKEFTTDKEGTYLSGYAPIYNAQGKVAALLVVDMDAYSLAEELEKIRNNLIRLYLVSLVAAFFLSRFLARRVVEPLQSLVRAVSQVQAGNLNQEVTVKSRDEVGELAESFNEMIGNLRVQTQYLNRKIAELATVNRVGSQVNSTLKLPHILNRIVDSAIETLGAEVGSLSLLADGSEAVVRPADKRTVFAPEMAATLNELVELVTGKVTKRKKAWGTLEGEKTGSLELKKIQGRAGITDFLAVPVVSKGEVMAVVGVYNKKSGPFDQDDLELLSTLSSHAAVAIENGHLYQEIQENFLAMIRALANAVDAKDPYTRGHSERVTAYAVAIAETAGLSPPEIESIRTAGLLHDIGKIGISEKMLMKMGKLTSEEKREFNKHVTIGAQILEPVPFPWEIVPLILHHHERYDGKGYPHGLKGEEIPLGARIINIADAYDAMTSVRPYRHRLSETQAVAEIVKNSGTQFDPELVKVFLSIYNTKIATIQEEFTEEKPPLKKEKVAV